MGYDMGISLANGQDKERLVSAAMASLTRVWRADGWDRKWLLEYDDLWSCCGWDMVGLHDALARLVTREQDADECGDAYTRQYIAVDRLAFIERTTEAMRANPDWGKAALLQSLPEDMDDAFYEWWFGLQPHDGCYHTFNKEDLSGLDERVAEALIILDQRVFKLESSRSEEEIISSAQRLKAMRDCLLAETWEERDVLSELWDLAINRECLHAVFRLGDVIHDLLTVGIREVELFGG